VSQKGNAISFRLKQLKVTGTVVTRELQKKGREGLPLSANYSTYLFRQRLCSRLTALWRYINFVLLVVGSEGSKVRELWADRMEQASRLS